MPLERHLVDEIWMSLFTREAVYGEGVTPWNNATGCAMSDYDDASGHIAWDDMVQGNTDVITGKEFATHQEIVRQGATMTYTEPRTKPNTIVGLLGLAMGAPPVATRDGTKNAWRHAMTMGSGTQMPSIIVHMLYDQLRMTPQYLGMKCSTITLNNNGQYWQLAATLLGSGSRNSTARPSLPLNVVQENWLRWGDTRVFIRPLSAGRIVVPTTPTQNSNDLTGGTVSFPGDTISSSSAVELSPFLRSMSVTLNNNFATEAGYRAGGRLLRTQLHAARREITVEFTFDIESTQERNSLLTYLNQYNMGLEVDCSSIDDIHNGGTMRYGFSLFFPCLRVTSVVRGQEDQLENLTYTCLALDDRLNDPMYAWVYNSRSRYLS